MKFNQIKVTVTEKIDFCLKKVDALTEANTLPKIILVMGLLFVSFIAWGVVLTYTPFWFTAIIFPFWISFTAYIMLFYACKYTHSFKDEPQTAYQEVVTPLIMLLEAFKTILQDIVFVIGAMTNHCIRLIEKVILFLEANT